MDPWGTPKKYVPGLHRVCVPLRRMSLFSTKGFDPVFVRLVGIREFQLCSNARLINTVKARIAKKCFPVTTLCWTPPGAVSPAMCVEPANAGAVQRQNHLHQMIRQFLRSRVP